MEFWIIFGLFWLVFGRFGRGRSCGAGPWGARHMEPPPRAGRTLPEARSGGLADGAPSYRERVVLAAAEKRAERPGARTDPVSRAQQDWIDGRLTDAEFEARLDAIYSKSRPR